MSQRSAPFLSRFSWSEKHPAGHSLLRGDHGFDPFETVLDLSVVHPER